MVEDQTKNPLLDSPENGVSHTQQKPRRKRHGRTDILFFILLCIVNWISPFEKHWGYFLPGLLLLIIALRLLRIRRRGYFWLDKEGNKLSFKEFRKRWTQGMEGITPLQQSKTRLMGTWITLSGIVAGMVVFFVVRIENVWWWTELILLGSLIVTGIGQLGEWQKCRTYKKQEQRMKEADARFLKELQGEVKP